MQCFQLGVSFKREADRITIGDAVEYILRDFDVFSVKRSKVLGVGEMVEEDAAIEVFDDYMYEVLSDE
jgi:hypothetical protein